jgi:hypothetical protein
MVNAYINQGPSTVAELPSMAPTSEAAPSIHRKPQTLRKWACTGTGPIQPVRVNGRLLWRIADLQRLLRGESSK